MKKVIAILLALLTLCAVAQAADGSVTYEGGAEKFVFLPGSADSATNLFDNFEGVMPGDEIVQNIRVKNDADKKVRIYIRADGASDKYKDFLNQLHLKVECSGKDIFDAQADEKAQLTKNTLLGTFKKGGETDLTVTLTVPIDLSSEYMNQIGVVPWTFTVEEVPDDATPETGDWFNAGVWIGAAILLAGLIVLILAVQQKKKKEA